MADPTISKDARAVISRKEAQALGLTRYFTGKLCSHGHVAERYTRNSLCCQCMFIHNRGGFPDRDIEEARRRLLYGERIISQREALASGLKYFFTGKPCIHGHVEERSSSDGSCRACRRVAVDTRRRAKPDELREYERARYAESRAVILEQHRLRRIANPEKFKARERLSRQSRRNKIIAYNRARYWENPTAERERRKAWAKANPLKSRIQWTRRRARKRGADGAHTTADIRRILKQQRHRCAYCPRSLRSGYHVDHIKALAKGGTNWPKNLQCLCPTCNARKNAKDPIDWARENGLLL